MRLNSTCLKGCDRLYNTSTNMRPFNRDPLTVPVKPFLYQPKPAAFTVGQLLSAQVVGVLCALFGWPLFFLISMALPLTLMQRAGTLTSTFALAYSALEFFAFGGMLGLAQLLRIANWVPGKKGWLISSGLVGLVVFPAAAYLAARLALWPAAGGFPLTASLIAPALAGALGGLLLGLAQAPFMGARRHGWRILSTITWAAAAPLAIFLFHQLAPLLRAWGG